MFNAMSDAEIACHHAELLSARTVLSLRSTGIQDVLGGNSGNAGNEGAAGKSPMDLLGWINHSGTADPGTTAAGATAAGSSQS
jgi:hypothetical protein